MGRNTPTDPGPTGNTSCPQHPDQPVTGMCGCGTFFCRKCSPSAVFCSRCNRQHQRMSSREQPLSMAHPALASLAHVNIAGGHSLHSHTRPLPQRLALEAALTLTVAVIVLIAMFTLQERSYSFEPNPMISYGINAGKEPLQSTVPSFTETVWHSGARAELTSDTIYTINARVQSTRAYSDEISVIMPYDFLLSWGDMADESVSGGLSWEQADRRGTVSGTIGGSGGPDISSEYVVSHVSNNHLIPASDGIRKALTNVRPGDMVRIEGRLVDVRAFVNDGQALSVTTSKSRDDQGDGACEVIYVEELRVNGQTY